MYGVAVCVFHPSGDFLPFLKVRTHFFYMPRCASAIEIFKTGDSAPALNPNLSNT